MYTTTLLTLAIAALTSALPQPLPQAGANLPSYAPYASYGTYGAAPAPPPPAAPKSYTPYSSYGTYGAAPPSPPPSAPPAAPQANTYLSGSCQGQVCVIPGSQFSGVGCDATAQCKRNGNACTFFTGNVQPGQAFATGKANCT